MRNVFMWLTISIIIYQQSYIQLPIAVHANIISKRNDAIFQDIVVFGDSMTDNRSFDYLYDNMAAIIDPNSLHPYTANFIMRNSDGPLWVEYLTAMLNDADLYTFARVGATVNNSLVFRPQPDFSGQVYRYTLTEDTTEPKYDKLYFIWLGGNDIAELYNNKKYPNNNVERDRILNDTQFTIRYNLEKLYETGARYIICLGVNPTHLYPANNDKTEEFRQSYKESIMKFNERLQTNIEDLNSRHNDSKAVFFETYKLFYSFFPEQTIMENSKWHCNYSAICNGIYWDKAHYSTFVHARIAQALYDHMFTLDWY